MYKVNVPGYDKKPQENHFNYTEDELGEKKRCLKLMHELYPDVPAMYSEYVYDICKNTPKEELDIMMKNIDTIPSKYVAEPGESHNLEIIDSKDSLINKIENKNITNNINESSDESI